MINIKIDGRNIEVQPGTTILDAAKELDIEIPSMCYYSGSKPLTSCMVCVVEIKGMNKLLPSCGTIAEEGMEVVTNSERLHTYRKMILDLLFSERNHVCSVCVSNGHCDLQFMASKLGMTHIGVPYLNPVVSVDASHDYFIMDHNRCILCQRCVRVCREVEGAHTKGTMGRGVDTRIITDLNEAWGDSMSCTSCGKCVQVCPTGALLQKGKSVAEMAKRRDFLPYLQMMRED